MAAGDDHQAQTNPIPKDMQLPPTPPDDYSNDHKTGLDTPPMETLQQLLTPDNTPPGMVLNPPRPLLGRDVSSRANSFRTAREEQSREFLNAATIAGSQVQEDALSDEVFASSDDDDDTIEEEPWRHIPGAFRNTPSTTSSRNTSLPSQRVGSVSTHSTTSSDKAVRPKQYLDVESPPSTGSSRQLARERQYRHDTESPLDRQRAPTGDHADGSLSYAHSERSSDGDAKESETSQHESVEGLEGESAEESDRNGDAGEDWENHVSYMAMDGENESVREDEGAATPARTGSPSSRLSGQGRRVGNNGAQHSDQFKGINNPPYSPSGISNKAAEQGLLKRGSDESSRQRSDETPSPSVGAQQRRQKTAHAESSPAAVTPRSREREARRLSWLRQHAGTLASPNIPEEFLAAPPRNSNDLVYKHIQQANMDRFDAIKNGQAVEAVVIPTDEARSRQLRHVTKRQSLRSISDNNSTYMPSGGPRRDHNLRHKKVLTPQKAPPQGSTEGTPNTRSVSGSHSLRHEKRPLSGTGRPLQSSDASPMLPQINGHSALQQVLKATKETPKLRHSSLPINLSSDPPKASPVTSDFKKGERRRNHALRRSSREYRLENSAPTVDHVPEAHVLERTSPPKDPSTIVETTTVTSPHLLGFDAHHRNRNLGTPFSVSAVSDRTDMEVCEAQNVAYYPHSNESLLVVQNHSKSEHKGQGNENTPAKSNRTIDSDQDARLAHLFPELPVQSLPAIAVNGKSIHTVESPLINPREAPIPPVIKFIPATPSHEDDEREPVPLIEEDIAGSPQRRGSLVNRARRYSEVVVRPLFGRALVTRSHHIHPSPTAAEKRDERLHPNWVPNSFWDDDDDDDDDDDYYESEEPFERLPAGGDTSEHPRAKFPRNMSVRMPGFRGSGGFLLGNSLGMDRHGTNKRRPHATPPGSSDSTSVPKKTLRRVSSIDSVTSRTSANGRIFSIPGTHTQYQYVGFQPLKDKIKKRRQTKEDAAKEKRRAELKGQIGMRIVHDA
jgi:hypothetical protein